MILDSGFLSNSHNGNNGASCRRSYVSEGTASGTVWNSNYAEADCGPALIITPSVWLGGQPASGFSSLTSAIRIDAGKFVEGVPTISLNSSFSSVWGGPANNLRSMRSASDVYGLQVPFIRSDSDDVDGGGYWTERAVSQPLEACEEQLTEQSLYGPYRRRFPIGFYLGKNVASVSGYHQIYWTACNQSPTSSSADFSKTGRLLWKKGDVVFNTLSDGYVAPGWIAARNGGWGGGRFHVGGIWSAVATISIGEGIEPTVSNGKVFRLLRFEVFSGSWARQDSLYGLGTSNTEPTWDPVDGNLTTELVDSTHRIIWECWGNVGMTWAEMPIPTTFVYT